MKTIHSFLLKIGILFLFVPTSLIGQIVQQENMLALPPPPPNDTLIISYNSNNDFKDSIEHIIGLIELDGILKFNTYKYLLPASINIDMLEVPRAIREGLKLKFGSNFLTNPEEKRRAVERSSENQKEGAEGTEFNVEIAINPIPVAWNDDIANDLFCVYGGSTPDACGALRSNPLDTVIIAVLDTGIDGNHPKLISKVQQTQYNSITSPNSSPVPSNPIDVFGHGTKVAGIIKVASDNADDLEILSIKILDNQGTGRLWSMLKGISKAIDCNVDIINISAGFVDETPTECPSLLAKTPLQKALEVAAASNILVITSAGNENEDNDDVKHYPSNFDEILNNVIGVAASCGGALEDYSNYGDMTVRFASRGTFRSTAPNNTFAAAKGTSFAAAYTTGLAASYVFDHPDYTPIQVKNYLINEGTSYSSLTNKTIEGKELLNLGSTNPANGTYITRVAPNANYYSSISDIIDVKWIQPGSSTICEVNNDYLFIGSNDYQNWNLYIINISSEQVGNVLPISPNISELHYDNSNNILYALRKTLGNIELGSINLATGSFALIHNIPTGIELIKGSSTFDQTNSIYYFLATSKGQKGLYSLHVFEGQLITEIHSTNLVTIEYNNTDSNMGNTLYGITDDNGILRLNSFSFFGIVPLCDLPSGICIFPPITTMDEANNTFIFGGMTNTENSQLYTVNLDNCVITSNFSLTDSDHSINYTDFLEPVYNSSSTEIFAVYMGACMPPLAIEYLTLKATPIRNEFIQLQWTTATEQDSKHFDIQRSEDNINFSSIGIVQAAGQSSSTQYYNFDDKNVKTGIHYYYQIRSVDKNDKVEISEIVTAILETSSLDVVFYPNPAETEEIIVQLSGIIEENIKITAYNQLGHLIETATITLDVGQHEFALPFKTLPKGIFFIEICHSNKKIVKKLVIL